MSPRLAFPCAIALLIAATGAVAAPASKQARAQAKTEFAAGQKAFAARDYAEALGRFKKAFELHPHDAVRFNIAVCLEKLERFREAVREYEAAAKSDQLDQAGRSRAEAKAEVARKELGTLAVEGEPEGAEVLVEGEQLCNLPCRVALDAKKHEVVIRSGDREERRVVLIRRQDRSVIRVELAPAGVEPASVPKTAAPPTAHVPLEPQPDAPRETRGPGWLTWTGAGLVVVGGAGVVIFGPQAQSAHDDFVETGSEDARDDGVRARNFTNVAIGVALLGAVAIGVDLLIFAGQPAPARSSRNRLEIRF